MQYKGVIVYRIFRKLIINFLCIFFLLIGQTPFKITLMGKSKQKPTKNRIKLILIGLVLLCLLINLIKNSNLKAPGVFASDYGNQLDISFDIYEDGILVDTSTLPYSFSDSPKNKEVELVADLPPEDFIDKAFISFRASGYGVRVEVEDNEIYSFYEEGTKDYGGAYWHFVKLPDNSSSKQIKIKLYCPTDDPFAHNLFPIYIGSKGYLLTEAFGPTSESLFFGITLIGFGLVFLGNIVFFNRSIGNSFLLSLSLLLICFGSWVLFQSGAKQLFGITNPAVPMEICFFAMFSLPFCIWFYVSTNYNKMGSYKFLKIAAFSILFLYIPIFIITSFGIPYTKFLALIGLLIFIYIISVLIIAIKLYLSGEKRIISCILAILSILLSVLAEEVLLILKINIGHVSILHTGMAVAAVIFIYQSIGNLIEKNTEDNQAKLLKKLAYLDVVTLVENRNSYERFIEEEGDKLDYSGLILADVNGLKIVNDMFGHKAGDNLLKKLSKKLKDNLPIKSNLYRVGGDEFVGIIQSITKEEFSAFIDDLRKEFIPDGNDFGMAIGSYFYSKKDNLSLAEGIEKADKSMYEHKELQKEIIQRKFEENGDMKESSLLRNFEQKRR